MLVFAAFLLIFFSYVNQNNSIECMECTKWGNSRRSNTIYDKWRPQDVFEKHI